MSTVMESASPSEENGTTSHGPTASLYLPLLDWETRVLFLHPAQDNEPLVADLIIGVCIAGEGLGLRNINRTIEYDALSYTWGEPVFDQHIRLKGEHVERDVAITSNLHAALQHLRQPDVSRYIWADAVCIDQSNPEERSAQVRGMFSIYKKASTVIIWLGSSNGPHISKALNLASHLESDGLGLGIPPAAMEKRDREYFSGAREDTDSELSAVSDSMSDISHSAESEKHQHSPSSEDPSDEENLSDGRKSSHRAREYQTRPLLAQSSKRASGGWEKASSGSETSSRGETASSFSDRASGTHATNLPQNIIKWNNPSCTTLSSPLDLKGEIPSRELTADTLSGLYELMDRAWLRRVWIIQEVFAARKISVQCGRHIFEWPVFRLLPGATEHALGDAELKEIDMSQSLPRLGEAVEAAKFLNRITKRRRAHEYRYTDSISPGWTECWCLQLILTAAHAQATDPRDRVYALLGLFARPSSRWQPCDHVSDFIVDYRKSVSHVYQDIVRHYLRSHARLDFLYLRWKRPSDLDFPSWLPDWRSCAKPSTFVEHMLKYHSRKDTSMCTPAYVTNYDILEIHGFKIGDLGDIRTADRDLAWIERVRCLATALSESTDVPSREKASVLRLMKKATASFANPMDEQCRYDLLFKSLATISSHQHGTEAALPLIDALRSLWQAMWHRCRVPSGLLEEDQIVQPSDGSLPLILRKQGNGRFTFLGFLQPEHEGDHDPSGLFTDLDLDMLEDVGRTVRSCGQDDVFLLE